MKKRIQVIGGIGAFSFLSIGTAVAATLPSDALIINGAHAVLKAISLL